jgi:hypothetical protein
MDKKTGGFDQHAEWYELWMKQSKVFYDLAEKNLKNVFEKDGFLHPENHSKEVDEWVAMLKKQWHWLETNEQNKSYENYLKMMSKMCSDATDQMMQLWLARSNEKKPVHSIRELYELWLNCCHDVYAKGMHSKSYQQAYGDLMNAAIHYWKSMLPK